MPVTRKHIVSVVSEHELFLGCDEVEDFSLRVVRARHELDGRQREREVANAVVFVGENLVLLTHVQERVHDHSVFVAGDDVLLKVRQGNCTHTPFVDGATAVILENLRVPSDDFSVRRACNKSASVFDPLDSEERVFLLVLEFSNKLGCHTFPVSLWVLGGRGVQVLGVRLMRQNFLAVFGVEVELSLLPVVGLG